MSLSRMLWEENADLANACLQHPFVQGLGNGTLERAVFQGYVGQDAYFLGAFARSYALSLARSPDADGMQDFFELLVGAMGELKLHSSYAARWELDLPRVMPSEATLAYTNFLLATAALEGIGETCAAMTPCMRLYAFLGQSLVTQGLQEPGNPYAEWVETYASADFKTLAATLERLLDRYGPGSAQARTVYRRAMILELGFFEASLSTPTEAAK
jgi:thiaminase (transcriptional activator TenA)